jgi:hypothetical protein
MGRPPCPVSSSSIHFRYPEVGRVRSAVIQAISLARTAQLNAHPGKNAALSFGRLLHPTADLRTLEAAKMTRMISVDHYRTATSGSQEAPSCAAYKSFQCLQM